ncbi:3,4-dihydroxy-2-butanone-4-phosphate synthase [Streptomyces lanatus]|uniref:3,4-dihydroxy-2-butanone-4-phosphate synthase n=1 Tax=Streptomyces lanatus TaxID=66900 RepID=A0ABV1Y5Y7_9ACTN|nr:3,4-dihydroxy-2-butanone-4-phosphate synthase [Streptomyces lanatus]GHH30364.1 hypothetical protein GCM10018780_89690 [Streptomyces lanatus]
MIDPLDDVLVALRMDQMIVVADSDDRENEGDLVMAAAAITTEQMAKSSCCSALRLSGLVSSMSDGCPYPGDRYQWLVAWQGCVTAVLNAAQDAPNPVVAVGVEVTGVGNVDDVVLYRKEPPHTYMQVKYATDSSTPVNEDYLLKPSDRGGPSILHKLASAWQQLTKDGAPVDLALLTNRSPDAADPLVQLRRSETQLLLPKAAQQGQNSKRG